MLPISNVELGKRKTVTHDFGDNKVHGQLNSSKTQIFKNANLSKNKQESEWKRATEGFSGFTPFDSNKTRKRKSLVARHPQKYRICMPCDSESESEVENGIKWSSSEEDLSPVSDIESIEDNAQIKSKLYYVNSKNTKHKDIQWEDNIDLQDSDNESIITPRNSKPVESDPVLIEDTESRSSFTMTGSNNSQINQNEQTSSIDISTEESATSSSPSQKGKVKASDWVKSLDLKTPTKQSPISQVLFNDDSAKKKKKYSRNGLADQLYKLQVREKSAVRMWNHQSKSEEKVSSKSVLVEVLEFDTLHSLQLAKCRDISQNKECYVLFSSEMAEEFNISVGACVRIFPPWQKLKLQTLNKTVILCTYYIKIEESHQPPMNEGENQKTKMTVCTMEWRCPCTTGLVQDIKMCPAYQFPSVPGVITGKEEMNESGKSDLEPSQMVHEQSLCMIYATQSSSGTTSCISDSILDSIDKSSPHNGICFKALIHRIHCKNDPQFKTKRYTLLVEDGHGVMCEVILPDNSEITFKDVIQEGEGKSYTLTGLKVLRRNTRDRDPALFSMIDSVWSGLHVIAVSEESETASLSYMSQVLPPGFCYMMEENERCNLKCTELSTPVASYKNTQITPLSDLKQDNIGIQRVSFKGQLVTKLLSSDIPSKDKDFQCMMYVTDNTLCSDYIVIKVKPICCFRKSIDGTVYFRDVLCVDGNFLCDSYSQISSDDCEFESDSDTVREHKSVVFVPPKLKESSTVYDLCTVEGIIIEIDEDSAYSWEVCDRCGFDTLAEKAKTRELVCLTCKRVVCNPQTKMKMEVYVTLPDLNLYRIRVNLLENTIQSLLPKDEADEGYDITSVLNSSVGPLWCVIVERINNEFFLKEIPRITFT